MATEYIIHRRSIKRHHSQRKIVDSKAKRKVIKAGRRGGKTVIAARISVEKFLEGLHPLYATPTSEQLEAWWYEVTRSLAEPIKAGIYKQNETEHSIERVGTKNRLRGKTAWNANTLRGDYADILILDEFQLMAEDTWDEVGAPMLLDNNGDAIFIFTPPSLKSSGISKAHDPRHASKLFKKALEDKTGLWEAFHFTSLDNPYISQEALSIITSDMSMDSYRREIMAQDDEIELSWLVYSKFNEALCKIPRFKIPINWPVFTGHDFGSANPAALFLAQVRLPLPPDAPGYIRYGDLIVFREYCPGSGYSIPQHRDRFRELTAGYEIKKSVGGNVTTEDEIRQGYASHGWPIAAPQVTRVNAQLDRVIGLMELNKIFIFNDLTILLTQIANCMWKLNEDNQITNKVDNEERYHLLACLRYIGSDFPPETASDIPMTVYPMRR